MPAPAAAEIILVRHGPSAHVERGWLDADGVRRWMIAYDAAEIALHHPPPPGLVQLAKEAGVVVASDLPRTVASAALLTAALVRGGWRGPDRRPYHVWSAWTLKRESRPTSESPEAQPPTAA